MSEPQIVTWVYRPEANIITAEVQGDGNSIVVATIPTTPPPADE